MKKFYSCALLIALTFATGVSALPTFNTVNAVEASVAAPSINIGAVISDFKLPDIAGKTHTLSSLRGKNGTVLIFMSAQCPVVAAYAARIRNLSEEYKARGVNFVGINSNVTESRDQIQKNVADNGYSFPMLLDKGNKIADQLEAKVTPEVYLLDASNKLVYHGRIDNSRRGDAITSNDLREALDALLAGKPIAKTEALAFGCSIKRAS